MDRGRDDRDRRTLVPGSSAIPRRRVKNAPAAPKRNAPGSTTPRAGAAAVSRARPVLPARPGPSRPAGLWDAAARPAPRFGGRERVPPGGRVPRPAVSLERRCP